ncbi:hypothetical protein HBA54_27215 [Pelagibius litoralis]|uniref:Uncharacterized protein n=1 Tax=Pelagibius litoralis TaxID=374515 RepID=A0A967F3F0_9PROT|nr:hypothetical protein [Pelagibius litoralis]NIA72287.1 hypothetical protein [Pelagibius litoralis]
MASRRGRKRKIVETRQPSGKLIDRPKADKGTPELQQKRKTLAPKGDPAKTTYPLGILWTNGEISDDEHHAGCKLAWLHSQVHGKGSVAAVRYGETWGGTDVDPDDKQYHEWLAGIEAELDMTIAALDACSRAHRDIVKSIAVYERTPRWLVGHIPTRSDVREGEKFKEGMKALVAVLGYRKKSAA